MFSFNKCSHCRGCMSCDLYLSPEYWLGTALFGGILFAGFSWGFVFFIIFILVWEFGYWIYTGYKNKPWDCAARVGIVLAALLGFIMGRTLHNKADHCKDYNDFKNYMNDCFKECGWKE